MTVVRTSLYIVTALTLFLGLMPGAQAAPDGMTWNFSSNSSGGWEKPHNLTVQYQNGTAVLDIKAPDSSLTNNQVKLDTASIRRVKIRYRATGLPEKTTGQIFYATAASPEFNNHCYWILPSLVSNGQWHTMTLDAEKQICLRSGLKNWLEVGTVTRLRLDIVDQAPGRVEIKSIMFLPPAKGKVTSIQQTGLNGVLLPFSSFDSNGARQINLPEKTYSIWARVKDNPATLKELAGITISGKKLNPNSLKQTASSGDFQWLKLGITKLGGNISLKLPGKPSDDFDVILLTESPKAPAELPACDWPKRIKTEIKRNQPKAKENPVKSYAPSWGGGMVTASDDIPSRCPHNYFLRRSFMVPKDLKSAWLQITADDSFTVYINGERVDTRQGDAWWHPGCAEVAKYLKPGQKNVVAIDYRNGGGFGGTMMDLTLNMQDKSYQKIVSDTEFKSYDSPVDGWQKPEFDDSAWRTVKVSPKLPTYPWLIHVPYQVKYEQPAADVKILSCNQHVSKLSPFTMKLRITSETPIKADDALWIKVFDPAGGELVAKSGTLSDFAADKKSDREYLVTLNGLVFPKFYTENNLMVKAGLYGYHNTMDGTPAVISVTGEPLPGSLTTEVSMQNGFPEVLINGKAVYPVIGNTAYYSGATSDNSGFDKLPVDIKNFWIGGMKIRWWVGPDKYDFAAIDQCFDRVLRQYKNALIMPWVWVMPPLWWQKLHPEEVALGSNGKPWSYYVSTPTFSSELYQKDAGRAIAAFIRHCEKKYGSRVFAYNLLGGVSAEWQGWGCHQADHSDVIQDYSKAAQRDFASFARKHYPGKLKDLTIPSATERLRNDSGVLRDPVRDFASIVYDEYYSNAMSDCIIAVASAAKAATGNKKLIGVYYGYAFEYSNLRYCLNLSGHNAMRKVLDAKDIDFFMSPPSYGVRGIGNCGEDMKPFTSIATAGKLSIIDDDTRTHLTAPRDFCQTINTEQTTAVFRRNLSQALCRQQIICLFPIEAGNDHNSPEIRNDAGIARRAGQYSLDNKLQRNSEIGIFVDDESFKYLSYQKTFDVRPDEPVRIFGHDGNQYVYPNKSLKLSGDLIYYQRARLAQIGAPVDYLLFSDLDKCIGKYKFYIFLNCFRYDDKMRQAVEKLKASGITALWLYAPGFFTNNTGNVENMRQLLGMKFGILDKESSPLTDIQDFSSRFTAAGLLKSSFGSSGKLRPLFYVDDADAKAIGQYRETGKVSLAVKKSGNSSFIFCGSNSISGDLLSSIAAGAGVHLYSRTLDVIFAGAGFLSIHSRSGGRKEIRLERKSDVIDIFSGQVIARNADKFEFEMPALQTRVFFLGNADKFKQYMKY